MTEYVVLVDTNNNVLGTAKKDEVHTRTTPLHRGFSLFLFNSKCQLLLQQRSHKKKTFPLIWSNSCCGHPKLDESVIDAAKRRVKDELGINLTKVKVILPDFRYVAKQDGIKENELCPVLVGFASGEVIINHDELEKTKWVSWPEFMVLAENNDPTLSSWSKEEGRLLNKNEKFRKLLNNAGVVQW